MNDDPGEDRRRHQDRLSSLQIQFRPSSGLRTAFSLEDFLFPATPRFSPGRSKSQRGRTVQLIFFLHQERHSGCLAESSASENERRRKDFFRQKISRSSLAEIPCSRHCPGDQKFLSDRRGNLQSSLSRGRPTATYLNNATAAVLRPKL